MKEIQATSGVLETFIFSIWCIEEAHKFIDDSRAKPMIVGSFGKREKPTACDRNSPPPSARPATQKTRPRSGR
jgi:hypothetical protein